MRERNSKPKGAACQQAEQELYMCNHPAAQLQVNSQCRQRMSFPSIRHQDGTISAPLTSGCIHASSPVILQREPNCSHDSKASISQCRRKPSRPSKHLMTLPAGPSLPTQQTSPAVTCMFHITAALDVFSVRSRRRTCVSAVASMAKRKRGLDETQKGAFDEFSRVSTKLSERKKRDMWRIARGVGGTSKAVAADKQLRTHKPSKSMLCWKPMRRCSRWRPIWARCPSSWLTSNGS